MDPTKFKNFRRSLLRDHKKGKPWVKTQWKVQVGFFSFKYEIYKFYDIYISEEAAKKAGDKMEGYKYEVVKSGFFDSYILYIKKK